MPKTLPALDLTECPGLVVVAPHPDDETLGLGATAAQLAASGVDVQVVSVSDGGAAEPGATAVAADSSGIPATKRTTQGNRSFGDPRAGVAGPARRSTGRPRGRAHRFAHGDPRRGRAAGLVCRHLARGRTSRPRGRRTRGGGGVRAHRRHAAGVSGVDVALGQPDRPGGAVGPRLLGAHARLGAGSQTSCRAMLSQPVRGKRAGRATPVLPAFVLQRLLAVGELVFR